MSQHSLARQGAAATAHLNGEQEWELDAWRQHHAHPHPHTAMPDAGAANGDAQLCGTNLA